MEHHRLEQVKTTRKRSTPTRLTTAHNLRNAVVKRQYDQSDGRNTCTPDKESTVRVAGVHLLGTEPNPSHATPTSSPSSNLVGIVQLLRVVKAFPTLSPRACPEFPARGSVATRDTDTVACAQALQPRGLMTTTLVKPCVARPLIGNRPENRAEPRPVSVYCRSEISNACSAPLGTTRSAATPAALRKTQRLEHPNIRGAF